MAKTELTCKICCESYNNDDILFINCSSCQEEACKTCVKQYVTCELREPCCMFCKALWSREFVMHQMERSWVNDVFLVHMGALIVEQEIMLMPYTQDIVRHELERRKLNAELKKLPSIHKLSNKKYTEQEKEKIKNRRQEIRDILASESKNWNKKNNGMRSVVERILGNCPDDNCRGYLVESLTSRNFCFCKLCSVEVCIKCRCVHMSDQTQCDKDQLETMRLLNLESKPCPKCYAPICKNGGCDQMFCVACHTAFSWDTGKIENGPIHNPYYFEWLANQTQRNVNGQNAADLENIACGQIPILGAWIPFIVNNIPYKYQRNFIEMYRIQQHIQHVILLQYGEDRVKNNEDLRVSYMCGDFDKEVWQMKLKNREKKRMKNRALNQLISSIDTILKDMIRRLFYEPLECSIIATEYNNLNEYYVGALRDIIKVHGGKGPSHLDNIGSFNVTLFL